MTQTVVHTNNSLNELTVLIREKNPGRVLVLTGSHFDGSKLAALADGRQHRCHHLVPPDGLLTVENIKKACSALPWHPDMMVAIGGGRILDAAKLVIHVLGEPKPYFVAIPTTAGSGSEATPFAVAYLDRKKISVQSSAFLSDHVLLDPRMLASLPREQRAISGIDALAQSIESTWNLHATAASLETGVAALKKIWRGLSRYVNERSDVNDADMLEAAYLAGRSIAITRTTGCHALSYYLTAVHNIPHGQAVGFFLPAFFIYNDRPEATHKLQVIYECMEVKNAQDACMATRALMHSCGLATRFSELGLTVDADALLDSVNEERFANNPIAFDRAALKELIIKFIA